MKICIAVLIFAGLSFAQPKYDLLLKGGHVIDAKNKINAVRDVAIQNGRIAEVNVKIEPNTARKVIDVSGHYVTPGLIDIHAHVYAGTGERRSYAGDLSLYPDAHTFRVGVTTVADAGCAGWRNFEDFKDKVIDRSRTRVYAFLNIVGSGMRGGQYENNLKDMEPKPAAEMALKHKGLIVGIKTAHYSGPEWTPVDNALEAAKLANIPVMVDFGNNKPERPLSELLNRKLRPGDIYTHLYSGLRGEQTESGHPNPALFEGRKRGIFFDVGHGGGSFLWRVAVPLIKDGFLPDSISTDLHTGSTNNGMKDMLNVMDKFLAMGLSVEDVIAKSTWNPAREIRHEELGNLSVGSPADVVVLKLETGNFGFVDMYGGLMRGSKKLSCELTFRDGKLVYELNGLSRTEWNKLPAGYAYQGDASWDERARTFTSATKKQ